MAEGPDCGRGLSLPAVDTTLGRLGSRASRGQTVLCSHHGCYPRPLSLSWGPQLLLTSCPGPAMCLRPHTPHIVLSTPQTGPSGCEHPPPRPPLHTTPLHLPLTFTSSQSPSPVDPASLSSAFLHPHIQGPRTTTSHWTYLWREAGAEGKGPPSPPLGLSRL